MKWFKHFVDSGDDPDIGHLISEFGLKGYYLFFRTLEIVAREFDAQNESDLDQKWSWFCSRFDRKLKPKVIKNFLKTLQKLNRISFVITDEPKPTIIIKFFKFRALYDEYTKKRIKVLSGVNPDSVRNKSGKNPKKNPENIPPKKKEVRVI